MNGGMANGSLIFAFPRLGSCMLSSHPLLPSTGAHQHVRFEGTGLDTLLALVSGLA